MAALDEDEPTPVEVRATCHTDPVPGTEDPCTEKDIPHDVTCYANAAPPIYRVVCMGCMQKVTDIVVIG
jgi:hypothetical protein